MEDIATAADITKPVLYQHFSSKTELYEAVLDSCIELFEHQVITPLLLDLDGRERTRRMISNFMSVVIDDPAAYRLIFLSDMRGQEQCSPRLTDLWSGFLGASAQRCKKRLRSPRPRVTFWHTRSSCSPSARPKPFLPIPAPRCRSAKSFSCSNSYGAASMA